MKEIKEEIIKNTKEASNIAIANAACAPATIVADYLKTKMQLSTTENSSTSYRKIIKETYEKKGAGRFFKGMLDHSVRNGCSCFLSSTFLVAAKKEAEKMDLSANAKAGAMILSSGMGESLTLPIESFEIKQKAGLSLSPSQTLQRGLKAAPAILGRNLTYGAGIVIPYTLGFSPAASFLTGATSGIASLPFDTTATRSFESNTSAAKTIKNIISQNINNPKQLTKTLAAGACARGAGIGTFSLATNLMLKYNEESNERNR